MRIIFFGTSHGFPEPNRRCSSTLIEVGKNRYFIDMGTQSIEQLTTRNIPVESVKAIFITHMHGDHTNGLISFVDLCNWYYKKADPEIYLPSNMKNTVAAIERWLNCNDEIMRDFKFRKVNYGLIYDDGYLKVTAFKTQHTADSYAFLIEAEEKRILFTGDLKAPPTDDFPSFLLDDGLDLAICELAHFSAVEKYLPIFKNAGSVKKICINHYSNKYLPTAFELINLLPNIPICFANDGMEFVL